MQKWKIHADYHTHTTYSHGSGSVEDNVLAARKRGLDTIAITDHGVRHPLVGVSRKKYAKIRADIDRVQERYEDVRVLFGIEANIVGNDGDLDLTYRDIAQLDLVLAGFHLSAPPYKLSEWFGLNAGGVYRQLFRRNTPAQRERNTMAFVRAVQRHPIDILTHPGFRLDLDYGLLGRACAEYGTYVEISSRHRVPDEEQLAELADTGVTFVIDSDAHKPQDVGQWEYAIDLCRRVGISPARVLNATDMLPLWRSRRTLVVEADEQ